MKLIVTADWHIRATKPRCRKDEDWMETQRNVLNQIFEIAKAKECDVFAVGDIFHSNSDTNFECINMVQDFADRLERECDSLLCIIAGNHDLPYHSSENLNKSAIGILFNSQSIIPINKYYQGKYSLSASNFDEQDNHDAEIVFKHTLTLPIKNPMFESETPETLVEKFPNAKWIFTGDYHKAFDVKVNGCHVINPGCLIRQVSDMKDYQCGVYYVDTEEEIVEFIPIIDNEELVDDSYITIQNEREERIDNFVSKLKDSKHLTLNFIENVENAIIENKISHELKNKINELLEM